MDSRRWSSFVAGADIGEQSPLDLDGGRCWGQRGSALLRRIEKLEFPTIAAVNGFALVSLRQLSNGLKKGGIAWLERFPRCDRSVYGSRLQFSSAILLYLA